MLGRDVDRGRYEGSLARTGKLVGAQLARGLCAAFESRAAGRFGILYYHRVCPVGSSAGSPPLNVEPQRFKEQVSGLLLRGYRFASLAEVVERADRPEEIPPKTVVMTFDDGYESVFLHAWSTLEELGVPATMFLASAFIGTGKPFPFDRWALKNAEDAEPESWRPLTWEACKRMGESGLIGFGTHSHTHRDFRGKPEELERDIRTSMDLIEQELGVRADLCSLPYGASGFADDDLIAAARRAGVRCALTTEIELIDPRSAGPGWGRLEAAGTDSSATLAAKLEGWYEWMERPRKIYTSIFK